MLYNSHSLEDDRVFTFNKRRRGRIVDSDEIPPYDAKLVGSSHGWLASFDGRSNHVFLSNPISGRHIKLPSVDTLPDPHLNGGIISRVILSASPDDQVCHAAATFDPGGRLAFCTVGAGEPGTPLGPALSWKKDENVKFAMRPCEDFVHSTTRGEFLTIQPLAFDDWGCFVWEEYGENEKHGQMFHWKIPPPPHGLPLETTISRYQGITCQTTPQHCEMLEMQCILMPHLVCAHTLSDHLPLIVSRYLHRGIGPNADHKLTRPDLYRARINTYPYKSVSFFVLEACLDDDACGEWTVVKDLKGLALFVGMNHSFAISATGKLKPNSIYFTDPDHAPQIYGGHDIGIFDYQNKTISPCYYPCDVESFKRIDPPPMWFTPTFN